MLHAACSNFGGNSCVEQGCLDWPMELRVVFGAEKHDAGLNA